MDFKFKSLIELVRYFKDEKTCYDFLEQQIWSDGQPACPHCGSLHVYTRKHRNAKKVAQGINEYKCAEKGCNQNFTSTVGTIFESSKLPLQTWFAAIWLCTTSSKGISSANLAKQLNITQKSAWFVLSRIREMFNQTAPHMLLTGTVECDEAHIGGLEKNKHASKRWGKEGRNTKPAAPKAVVFGALEREGELRTFVVPDCKADTLQPIMRNNVHNEARIITDSHNSYKELRKEYNHVAIKGIPGVYTTYGDEHTNNIEGFWSILQRGIIGVYHFTSHKHLQRYCNEFTYRYNNRELSSAEKFGRAIEKTVKARITYNKLTSKESVV